MEFVVKGETREGRIMILKRGFASQDKGGRLPSPDVGLETSLGRARSPTILMCPVT
jgi:hypothetical protein